MKKLPQIYKGNQESIKTNNKNQCIVEKETKNEPDKNEKILNSVFEGLGYPFNIMLEIKIKKGYLVTSLIGRTKNAVITMDNDIIPYSDIISVTRKKN